MTTQEIFNSKQQNKKENYITLAKRYLDEAVEFSEVTGNIFVEKIVDEIKVLFEKCRMSDCEFTAYVNCNACEIWFSKIEEQF